ncbi:DUF1302 domain-containing protein [Massilia cavernae]|uniref:DUF1302 family protein n=1 Tax=Massilia cavernae TaxID=2320864 RepID=A0A418Y6B6_9BURK|nr:DUF1302 family protein [Massilia cavernae]RJG23489.1 DUF1302 family protein [Massilia cavernae]
MQFNNRQAAARSRCAPSVLAVAVAALCASGGAAAIDLSFGNPDINASWGNTVRYNAGWRMNERNAIIAASRNNDEGTFSFDKHDMVTSRLDLLTEFDFNYRTDIGFRVSAAAWKDFAFNKDVRFNPAIRNNISSYNNDTFSQTTERFQGGLSGEILDAYVFANFSLGGMNGNIKAGRQTVLWGESLILSPFSVSDGQAPIDGIKGLTTPGVDAKEVVLPIGQVSGSLQLTPTVSILGQYYYEWRNSRAPNGGTYLAATDFILDGPDRLPLANGAAFVNNRLLKPKERGDWGIAARWTPGWMNGGTLGAYYRDFTEKSASASINPAGGNYQFFFPRHQKLLGLSLAHSVGGVSIGAEIVRRQDAVLNTVIQNGALEAARGDAWTGLVNGVALLGPNSLWSSAAVIGELGYSRLDKVTSGDAFFPACWKRPAGDQSTRTGCSSRDNWQAALRFSPGWTAVRPGWDAALNLALTYGIKGNSPLTLPDHGNEGAGSYSVGATWVYNARHDFTLAYIDYLATHDGLNGAIRVSNGSQRQDRGWLSFTYKGSF